MNKTKHEFNADADAVDFGLPILPGARWPLAVDTSREAPEDLIAAGEEPLWEDSKTYRLSPRTSVILVASFVLQNDRSQ